MWKVVIIDDDFQVVRGLRKAIPWDELEAEFAGEAIDGEAGLKLIEEVNPDIVLTDIYMPVMNGIEMIEQLKQRDFTGRFVILSGYNDFEYARTALRLGVDDYLTKPVTLEQIRSVLAETIEKLEETYLQRMEHTRTQTGKLGAAPRKEECLSAVLNGWNSENVLSSYPSADIWDKEHTMMVIEVLWNERIRSISLADWNLFKFAVSNIITEVSGEKWPDAIFVWLFGNHAALLLPSGAGSPTTEIQEAADQLGSLMISSMHTFLGLEIRYALGKVGHSFMESKASADEAMQKLFDSQAIIMDSETPGGQGTLAAESKAADKFSLNDYYQAIIRALQEGQDSEVMSLIRLFLDHRQPEEERNPLVYRVLAAELWALLHNAMLIAGLPTGKSEEEALALRELSEMTERARIEEWLETQIRVLRKGQAPAIHEKHRKAVQFMIEYIHEHYAEDITLEQMASQLYISRII